MLDNQDLTRDIPVAIVDKLKEFFPLIETAYQESTSADKLQPLCQAAFTLLDADRDGKLSKDEVLALGGLNDPDRDPEAKFEGLFNLVGVNKNGQCNEQEMLEFYGRVYDVLKEVISRLIDISDAVETSVCGAMIKYFVELYFGEDGITQEKFAGLGQ